MKGTQSVLTSLVLLGGLAMLLNMINWIPQDFGIIGAIVAVGCFGLMAYGDMKAHKNQPPSSGPQDADFPTNPPR